MSSADPITLTQVLVGDAPNHQRKVIQPLLTRLQQRLQQWQAERARALDGFALESFLATEVELAQQGIERLQEQYAEFLRRCSNALDDGERQQHILNLSRDLGASERDLRRDRQAFQRWFAMDAMADRYRRRLSTSERELVLLLEGLGRCAHVVLVTAEDPVAAWGRLDLESVVTPLFTYQGDDRVRSAAFSSLALAVEALPRGSREQAVTANNLQFIYRCALDRRRNLWLQRAALRLLHSISARSFIKVVRERLLVKPGTGDDLFLRCYGVDLIGRTLGVAPQLSSLLRGVLQDPSAAVRQRIPAALLAMPESQDDDRMQMLRYLLREEQEPAVRAAALLVLPRLLLRSVKQSPLTQLLQEVLQQEQDPFVLRVALLVVRQRAEALDAEAALSWFTSFQPALQHCQCAATSLAVRRWAAQVQARLWLLQDGELRTLFAQLQGLTADLKAGRRRRLPPTLAAQPVQRLMPLLAVLAEDDYGYSVEQGLTGTYLRRGERLGFRLWRLLHELRHPSPDKRQAHSHILGRIYYGLERAPSALLAELAETKVPGEPLYQPTEQGGRGYLPLVDELISSLDQAWPTRPYRIWSPDGLTEVMPPSTPWGRLWARGQLTWHFGHYARLRNWQPGSAQPPQGYLQALTRLGFRFRYQPHSRSAEPVADPHVVNFFPAVLPLPVNFDLSATWQGLLDYFVSVYENSLLHLGIFITAASAYFFGRHIYLNQRLRQARKGFALVIGGWGTRGKSGTERLKAALFNGLGYSLVSKTTGCEAMFIVAPPNGRLREMFLFRPYEKATIWEQYNLVRLAERMHSEVFLWECMGLTPSYIRVLQHDWMRDDLSTITNTYPDHEDLQGPAGYDIPRVMTQFIPPRSILVTSEEQMLPILRDGARANGSELRSVGWLQAGLLTPDILSRFPYEEHPYNIALVLDMAEALGIERDFALKEMADRVVPDLGVLKAYPVSCLRGRRLRYVMGMSANERFGTLNNWQRMGFDRMGRCQRPDLWVAAVVNNRADRIPRSRVFAKIMLDDLSVDRYLLIGANLSGLLGYVREAWEEGKAQWQLWVSRGDADPLTRLQQLAERLRVATDEQQLRARFEAALSGLGIGGLGIEALWDDPEQLALRLAEVEQGLELLDYYRYDRQSLQQYQQLRDKVAAGAGQESLEAEWLELAWHWFSHKLVMVEDYHASGDQVVEILADQCQPGLLSEIMGLQNIKGTGLDFVYRWQAWESCHNYCRQALGDAPQLARESVSNLAQFAEFGPLCQAMVEATLEQLELHKWAQREEVQAELVLIQSHLEQALKGSDAAASASQSARRNWLVEAVEAFIDSGDAVKRRKLADRIYQDLADERISLDRAAQELQRLNKRQKGGWLLKQG